jgi:hypothetical protein
LLITGREGEALPGSDVGAERPESVRSGLRLEEVAG